ncbi:DNA polymerase III, beta subunit [Malonomonas rubra DSM 5091]|uniref:Beta sliding clamp n=1 Tax=Malonomonas rubra DSM 5091 TaxID=1122189 RepID=A0A1M6JU39_MALRU|nr:DNA polymerase III subunit beta [Malonomonas rubra]SHJ50213.1 DNA polymerase III, beta subunit [Malonomonas rubra DSM 5091]
MQFHISKETFLKGLTKVQGIIEKRHTIPILANVLIEAKNNEIIITATDLEVGIKSNYNADVITEGKVTVSAKKLFEIIKELPNKTIKFTSKSNFWVEITCEKSIFNLVGLSPDEFPKFPDLSNNLSKINTEIFKEMIDKTIFSVSNDETKFNLTGIFIKSEVDELKNNMAFVSTDGHRLSMIERNLSSKLDDKFKDGFILPKKGINEIRKMIDGTEEEINIGISDNNFSVSTDATKLIMRMVDGDFPDYKRVVPEKTTNSAVIDRELFLHSLRRISVLSSEKSKGVKINLSNDCLTLYSSNPDIGDAKEELDVVYTGAEISIGFNAKYIIDILQSIDKENVILFLKDNISPGLIQPENDEDYLAVIMPMRL